jgi:hypothetical protein
MTHHADIAEAIIRSEVLLIVLAAKGGVEADLREARDILKGRLIKELDRVFAAGRIEGGKEAERIAE